MPPLDGTDEGKYKRGVLTMSDEKLSLCIIIIIVSCC